MVKILQFNIQSIIPNKDKLNYFLNSNNIDISILSEIFKYNNSTKIMNYNTVTKTRQDGFGGVAIILKNDINFRKIRYDSNLDILLIETTNLKPNLIVASIYFPPNHLRQKVFEQEISKLLNFLDAFPNVLIGGDFNARNMKWGDNINLPRGVLLEKLLDRSNFRILNDGSPTYNRFSDPLLHASVLDLTLVNSFTNWSWKTLNVPITGSHHKPILIESNFVEIDCKLFIARKKLICNLSKIRLSNNMDEILDTFTSELKKCTYKCKSKIPKCWWNDTTEKNYRLYIAAWQKCQKFTNPENILNFREKKNIWQESIRSAKQKSWSNRIEELNKNYGTREAWRFINNVKKCRDTKYLPPNWSTEVQNSYLTFLKSHTSNLNQDRNALLNDIKFNHTPFTDDEFKDALDSKKKITAAGEDGLKYDMLKALNSFSRKRILEAFNSIWETGKLIDSWRHCKIIPIPKKDKNLDNVENFRPICLISCALKVMETMMKNRMENTINANNLLPANSFAFTKKKSATMMINQFLHKVKNIKSNGEFSIAIVLDINKAYDCLDLTCLKKILLENQIDKQIVHWVLDSLSKRLLSLGGSQIEINNGVPQGSSISPLLFNLYTAKLHLLANENFTIYQFADDFVLLFTGKTILEATVLAQNKLTEFYNECKKINLSFNPEKTKMICFSKGKNNNTVNIQLNNQLITNVEDLKLLGFYISSNLINNIHYKKMASELEASNNALKMLTPVKSGLNPRVSLNTFKAMIRSKAEYSRTATTGSNKNTELMMERLLNGSIRRCLGVPPNTPNHILYALSCELPPKYRSFLLTARELVSLKLNHNQTYLNLLVDQPQLTSSYSITFSKFQTILESIEIPLNPVCKSNKITVEKELKGFYSLSKGLIPNHIIRAEYSSYIKELEERNLEIISTDASIKENVGIAIYDKKLNLSIKYKLEEKTSSLMAELLAIEKSIEYCLFKRYTNIAIFTDSRNTCIHLSKEVSENYIVHNIKSKIENSNIEKVIVVWTPAHVGIDINEIADCAANMARISGIEIISSITPSEGLTRIKDSLFEEWQNEYESISRTKGKFFFEIFPKVETNFWFSKMDLTPKDIKTINRLLCNHSYNKDYLASIGKEETNLCDRCLIPENNEHIFIICQKYSHIRNKYSIFDNLDDLITLLKTRKQKVYSQLLSFAKDINFET